MENPELYARMNFIQRKEVEKVTDEFKEFFNEKCRRVIDIGSGTGDSLCDFVASRLDKRAEIIGMDVSKSMVEYAKENHNDENVKFVVGNIQDVALLSEGHEVFKADSFDLVTSFYTLNWVSDQTAAFKNIFNLLKPNGACLILFVGTSKFYRTLYKLSLQDKYSEHLKGVEQFLSYSYFLEENPLEVHEDILRKAGFEIISVRLEEKNFQFQDEDSMKDFLKTVFPNYSRMPKALVQECINDCAKVYTGLLFDTHVIISVVKKN